jgi:ubiquinone biosynthesis protein COQ9
MPRARKKAKTDYLSLVAKQGVEKTAQDIGSRTALYAAIIAEIDTRIAAEPLPFDKGDNTRDRLFALLMQRIDVLQEHRPAFLKIITALIQHPADLRALGTPLYRALNILLRQADAPHTPAHTAALAVAYISIIAAWRNDTSADLSKTMKACDRALGILENIAQII